MAISAAVLSGGIPASAQESGLALRTVVIDAGHGGNDPGAISLDSKLTEKSVVLDVALTLGKMIKDAYPDVNVIYTRDKDVFIPLNTRADIANKNHADLFISLHCNSVPKNKTAPSGCETYVMGMSKSASNMEVSKRENSVILLEDDYTTKYQGYDPDNPESAIFFNLMQNAYFEQSLIMAELCQKHLSKGPISTNRGIKQGALLVLWRTTMPSVLVEMGFITNKSDRNTLASKEKRTQIASRLLAAFKDFKEQYDGSVPESGPAPAAPQVPVQPQAVEQPQEVSPSPSVKEEPEPSVQEEPAVPAESAALPSVTEENPYFAIQIFAVSRNLSSGASEFKGLKEIGKFKVGNLYKYTTGHFKSEQDADAALSSVRAKFKDAFIVRIDGGKPEKIR
ncbi:MAG: N-acetylmuramoyl-L-alanine amidase [Bacteroidales bacterium]|nr:N-acetylmuramoyl-L-alanine amidase [Bacteroidales bacterium]